MFGSMTALENGNTDEYTHGLWPFAAPLLSAKCKSPSKFQKEDNSAQRTAGPKRNKIQSYCL